jgi:tRNA nucleotidyltransferase (CCA-adding enzyme)
MHALPDQSLQVALDAAYPELERVREAATDPVHIVGGAVRDLLLGRGPSDNLDLVVEGDPLALARALATAVLEHERFATATIRLDGLEVDVAAARTETYAHPGALPEVTPVADIEADLGRRDFTINAMAVPLSAPRLVDPHGGRADLEAGLLRVLHRGSFVDDPTRALRAARYAARFGFAPEPATETLLREADLSTVSRDRREADLLGLAAEPEAARGFELLAEWGLVDTRPDGVELARRVGMLLESPPWHGFARRDLSIAAAALGPPGAEVELSAARPDRPSQGVELARGRDPVELALARALGADWLDDYLGAWRRVALEIDGEDLIAAGVPEGPAVGRGLKAALRGKLDGEIASGRSGELEVALEAARGGDGVA